MLKKSTSEETIISNALPVLKVFKSSLHKPLRLIDVEKRIRLSHQAVFRKIRMLESSGILEKTGGFYKPDFGNILTRKILELISAKEREDFFEKYPKLKEPFGVLADFAEKSGEISYIVLFGSYATGKATKTSDIDIFIALKGNSLVRKKIDGLLEQIEGGYFLKKYGFSPVYATHNDVKEMISERKKFMQSIIEEGVIIYGEENYFREIPAAMKEWSSWK